MGQASTRDRLFLAARELFDASGEAGLSMRRLAAAVGISPMAIYKHYADKNAILNALMLDGFASWEARVAKIDKLDPLTWCCRAAEAFLDFALEEPRRYQAAFLLNASEVRRYPNDFADGRSPVMSQMYRKIEQLSASIGAALPPVDTGLVMAALCQGLVSMYHAGRFESEAEFRAAYRRTVNRCITSYMAETR